MTPLTRSTARARAAAPVRAVHLGLGGFHRAHQACYTDADPEWGIAAYTFRNTELPAALREQDGLYSLMERGEPANEARIISSITRAHPGIDNEQWLADLASTEVAVLTLTVTEAGYQTPVGGEDSAITRVLSGLRARFRTNAAPVTLVPCDNLPNNGGVLREALRSATTTEDRALREWIDRDVSIVTTVVDRITPATTEQDRRKAAELTGFTDLAPVVSEPFTEWLLSGTFPAGRPAWERAGARFTDDVDAYERRKLWFLNGAHTLLAYVGLARGFRTVSDAINDDALAGLVQSWWDTAAAHMPLPADELAEYQQRLRARFSNPGIRHRLEQIAADGSQKIPARLLPVLRAERSTGKLPRSVVVALAAWIAHLRNGEPRDPRATEIVALARSTNAAQGVLAALDPELGEDAELVAAVETQRPDVARNRT